MEAQNQTASKKRPTSHESENAPKRSKTEESITNPQEVVMKVLRDLSVEQHETRETETTERIQAAPKSSEATDKASKGAQPKHLTTSGDTTSGGITTSTSTTATKRRLKQEARKHRNICNPPTSSDEDEPQPQSAVQKQGDA